MLTLFGEGKDLDAVQMAMRAVAVFVLTLAMIRLSGRRSFGQHRAFDTCTTVLMGSVLSRAVAGVSPFWPTMAAGATIVLLHRIVAMGSCKWPWFETLISGDRRDIVKDGRLDERQMRKALLTRRDLDEAIRKKAGDEDVDIDRAVLERDGVITVKLREDD